MRMGILIATKAARYHDFIMTLPNGYDGVAEKYGGSTRFSNSSTEYFADVVIAL